VIDARTLHRPGSKRQQLARMNTDEDHRADYILYRQRVLPKQIAQARAKLAALENECRRYGMNELLETNS